VCESEWILVVTYYFIDMKKFFIYMSLLFSLVGGFFAVPAHAQLTKAMDQLNSAVGPNAKVKTGLSDDLAGTVGTVVKGILGLTGTIFLLLTVYAGILWMTAQGSEEQVQKSMDIIKTCAIGLAITLSAYSITFFVTGRLSKASVSSAVTATGK
jgi:hypothetical protein